MLAPGLPITTVEPSSVTSMLIPKFSVCGLEVDTEFKYDSGNTNVSIRFQLTKFEGRLNTLTFPGPLYKDVTNIQLPFLLTLIAEPYC